MSDRDSTLESKSDTFGKTLDSKTDTFGRTLDSKASSYDRNSVGLDKPPNRFSVELNGTTPREYEGDSLDYDRTYNGKLNYDSTLDSVRRESPSHSSIDSRTEVEQRGSPPLRSPVHRRIPEHGDSPEERDYFNHLDIDLLEGDATCRSYAV